MEIKEEKVELKAEESELISEEKMESYKIENQNNEQFLSLRLKLDHDVGHLTLIKDFYSHFHEELPNFYVVNSVILSMNNLQLEHYLGKEFMYYNTHYRDSIRKQIDKHISSTSHVHLNIRLIGLMGTGKSFFLSDYVLRKRVQCKNGKVRILYINNSQHFLQNPIAYLFNEIQYMICFDFENNDQFNFKQQLATLYKSLSPAKIGVFYDFFENLKIYYNAMGIKVIIIWDQINVLYQAENKENRGYKIYLALTQTPTLFNHVILSASNNNKEIQIEGPQFTTIKMDPFAIFNKKEFISLITAEAIFFNLIPSNFNKGNISEYIADLCEILNFSITEYHSYKFTAWNSALCSSSIQNFTAEKNQNSYFKNRKIAIRKSERKFREEYLRDDDDFNSYYLAQRKIRCFNENISISENTSDCYEVKGEPKNSYNKQLVYYTDKYLVCTSALIRDEIVNLRLETSIKLNPWSFNNRKDGDMFQLQVQSNYLNKLFCLNLEKKMQFEISNRYYFYDCLQTIKYLTRCKNLETCILCHFLQANHFAFDSMLYDGITQTLVLIQITINKNHDIHYGQIEQMIKNQKLLGDFFKKYNDFFANLNKYHLVNKYVFQWITDQQYDVLVKRSDEEKKKLEPGLMEIFPFHSGLIHEIEEYISKK